MAKRSDKHLKAQINARLSDEAFKWLSEIMQRDELTKAGALEAALRSYAAGKGEPTPEQALRVLERVVRGKTR